MKCPAVDFLHQVDAEHGQKDGEAIHDAEHNQLILEGQDAQVGEREEQDERHEWKQERREYRGDDLCRSVQVVLRFGTLARFRFVIGQLVGDVRIFHIRFFYLLNRATGIFNCWRYFATVRRASG